MHLLTTFVTYSRLLAGPALITLLTLVLLFLRWVPQVLLFEVEQIAGFLQFGEQRQPASQTEKQGQMNTLGDMGDQMPFCIRSTPV